MSTVLADLALFSGKIALVTGAAQGIGEATARLLADRGIAGLILTDRNVEKGEAVAKSMPVPAHFVAADLADLPAIQKLVPAAEEKFGRLDVLCNVGGNTERGTILDTDPVLFDRIIAVNFRAPFFLMQDAAKLMLRKQIEGTMVNVSSVNAHGGGTILAAYSASKAALVNLTKNTAAALAVHRIRVNCVLPGWVDTPGEHDTLRRFHNVSPDWLEEAEKNAPFGRLLKSDDIARSIVYLASSESALMTGSILDYNQNVPATYASPLDPRKWGAE
jgi:NAD(P)-dependent dehydrogenase (short-subunit alcohol dehydrogenase family)